MSLELISNLGIGIALAAFLFHVLRRMEERLRQEIHRAEERGRQELVRSEERGRQELVRSEERTRQEIRESEERTRQEIRESEGRMRNDLRHSEERTDSRFTSHPTLTPHRYAGRILVDRSILYEHLHETPCHQALRQASESAEAV